MKQITLYIITLFATLLTSCSGDGSNSASKEEQAAMRRTDSLAFKVAVTPSDGSLSLYVAEKLGLLDSLHANVRLKKYNALSECRLALQHNIVEASVIDSALIEHINTIGKADIKGNVIGTTEYHFLTAQKARLRRTSQLADKVTAADSHGASLLIATMITDSIQRAKQQTFIVQVEDLNVRTQMLISGNVDAALLPEPYASKAQEAGAYLIKQPTYRGGKIKMTVPAILAYHSATLNNKHRKQQYQNLMKAIAVANDSINKYGKKHYELQLLSK